MIPGTPSYVITNSYGNFVIYSLVITNNCSLCSPKVLEPQLAESFGSVAYEAFDQVFGLVGNVVDVHGKL